MERKDIMTHVSIWLIPVVGFALFFGLLGIANRSGQSEGEARGRAMVISEMKASPGETYEVSVKIGDKVVVADKGGKDIKFTTPENIFTDKRGLIHIVSPGQIFTSQDTFIDSEGRMIRE